MDILVVEDDHGIRTLLRDALTLEGHDVRLAYDGLQALDELERALPQLMLFDVAMPRLDGFGLLDAMERRGWRALFPVLMVTARAGLCAELRGEMDIDDCVQKPFDLFDLIDRVERLLRDSGSATGRSSTPQECN